MHLITGTLLSVEQSQYIITKSRVTSITRKHNIATPNSDCRDSSALCYIDCCNLPGKSTTYGCVICCCATLQHNFIWKVQSARLLPESDNNSTSNFFKTYSNMQLDYLSDILLPEQAGPVNWDIKIGYKSSF